LIDGTSGLPKGRDEALKGLEAEKANDKIVQGRLNAVASMQGAHSQKTQHARDVYLEKEQDKDKAKPAPPGGAAHNVWSTLAAARGAALSANGGGKPFSMADAAVTARAKQQQEHQDDTKGEAANKPAASAGAGGASSSSSAPSLNAAAAPKVGGAALIGGGRQAQGCDAESGKGAASGV